MAKKNSQLVCQHLENVSRKMLEEYQDKWPRNSGRLVALGRHEDFLKRIVQQAHEGSLQVRFAGSLDVVGPSTYRQARRRTES